MMLLTVAHCVPSTFLFSLAPLCTLKLSQSTPQCTCIDALMLSPFVLLESKEMYYAECVTEKWKWNICERGNLVLKHYLFRLLARLIVCSPHRDCSLRCISKLFVVFYVFYYFIYIGGIIVYSGLHACQRRIICRSHMLVLCLKLWEIYRCV